MVASGILGLGAIGFVSLALMSQPPAEEAHREAVERAVAEAVAEQPVQLASWEADITPFDHVMGSPDAPVTIIEYASFTCGHCANFHTDTLPALKEAYVDTGLARFIFRDFPLDGLALRAGMLARCGRDDQYFGLVDAIFSAQPQWIQAEEPLVALQRLGSLAGIGPAEFEACMADENLSNRIIELRLDAQERYDIRATPSFVVGGEVVSGHLAFEEFAALIEGQLPEQSDD
jgi:protein-disulfide isomerase